MAGIAEGLLALMIILFFALFLISRFTKKPLFDLIQDFFSDGLYINPKPTMIGGSKQVWQTKSQRL